MTRERIAELRKAGAELESGCSVVVRDFEMMGVPDLLWTELRELLDLAEQHAPIELRPLPPEGDTPFWRFVQQTAARAERLPDWKKNGPPKEPTNGE